MSSLRLGRPLLCLALAGCQALYGYSPADAGSAARDGDATSTDDGAAATDEGGPGVDDGAPPDGALVSCATPPPGPGVVAGRVFEDVDFAGGAGGAFSAGDRGLGGVTVELHDAAGQRASAITGADGGYRFTGLAPGRYVVQVLAASIGDADTPPAGGFRPAGVERATAEQTYECDGVDGNGGNGALGGEAPAVAEQEGGAEGEHVVAVQLGDQGTGGVDLGFSFVLVVNTNEGGQGSLRAFIENANRIARPLRSRFQIPDGRYLGLPADQSFQGQAAIEPESPLPKISADDVAIDATTQTDTVGDTNPDGPEVRIDGDRAPAGSAGLTLRGSGQLIRGIEVRDFGGELSTGILLDGSVNATVTDCALEACGHAGDGYGGAVGLINGAESSLIQGCQFVDNPRDGIHVRVASDVELIGNELKRCGDDGIQLAGADKVSVVDNAISASGDTGIEIQNAPHAEIRKNRIEASVKEGIYCSAGEITATENEIRDNRTGILLDKNCKMRITRNVIAANGQLGIDIEAPDGGPSGVNPNDPGDVDTGPNDQLNFPVLLSATLDPATAALTVEGHGGTGMTIECFGSDRPPDESGHGEGELFVGAEREGCAAGSTCLTAAGDERSDQSGDPAAPEAFRFVFPTAPLKVGDQLTCTASDAQQTSEFSANVTVTSG